MALRLWDPYREMVSLRQAMDRLFDESFVHRGDVTRLEAVTIPLDLYEEGNNLIVKASLPGLKPEAVKVEVRGDVLTISGEMKQDTEHNEKDYHLHERAYSRFERSVVLPAPIQTESAEAVYEDGVLTLTLPKAVYAQSKSISVTARK